MQAAPCSEALPAVTAAAHIQSCPCALVRQQGGAAALQSVLWVGCQKDTGLAHHRARSRITQQMRRLARRAVLLNVNEPETRGVALALQTVLDDLGKGLGPLLVSLMVSAWGACVPLPDLPGVVGVPAVQGTCPEFGANVRSGCQPCAQLYPWSYPAAPCIGCRAWIADKAALI